MSANSRFESSEPSTSEWAVNQDFFSISRKQMPDGFRRSTECSEAVRGRYRFRNVGFRPKIPILRWFLGGATPHFREHSIREGGKKRENRNLKLKRVDASQLKLESASKTKSVSSLVTSLLSTLALEVLFSAAFELGSSCVCFCSPLFSEVGWFNIQSLDLSQSALYRGCGGVRKGVLLSSICFAKEILNLHSAMAAPRVARRVSSLLSLRSAPYGGRSSAGLLAGGRVFSVRF